MLKNVIFITNTCIKLGYWPSYFKISSNIVIPKPNKTSYDFPKVFWSIILLNMMGKLIEKVISNRIQLHVASNNFIYHSQLDGLKFKSITNADVALTYFIHTGWVKNLSTSTPPLTFHNSSLPSITTSFLLFLRNQVWSLVSSNFSSVILSIEKRNMFRIISPLILLMLTLVWTKAQLYPLFFWLYI